MNKQSFNEMIVKQFTVMVTKDEIAAELFSIEESAMLSSGNMSAEPDLLLKEFHLPTVGKLMAA
jgi:hypothetical protein